MTRSATPYFSPEHSHLRKRYVIGGIIALVIALLIAGRLYLNVWLLNYVNDALNKIDGYEGTVESIDVALYRGAYRIHKLQLFKQTGKIPTPFIDIDTTDLSIQWGALLHGRIVSNADLTAPVINFAVNQSGTAEQTGAGVDWTKPIKDLMPIDINLVTFKDGKLTYQDFSTTPKVNVYIHHMSGEARNLRNVVDASQPLPSTIVVKGDSIGGGNLEIKGKMNILKEIPDMDLETKLEHVHLPALSDYSNAYAGIDIKDGNLNVYSEFIVKDSQVSGYVKPIATHVSLIDLRKPTNPIKLAWETVVATVVEIFTNHAKDQFATKIPLEGNLKNVDTDTWSAISGIIRNAFVHAFRNGLDSDKLELKRAP
jgi:hypothetical protein